MSAHELLPCPFCGGAAHLSTIGRSWYRITADHADSCFLDDRETDCPQTDEQLQLLLRDWNTRSSYTAVDMSTAAADGLRDGRKSVGLLTSKAFITLDCIGGQYSINMKFQNADDAYAAHTEIATIDRLAGEE